MRFFISLLLASFVSSIASGASASGTGAGAGTGTPVAAPSGTMVPLEGLPLPWPFPWAKECPVNWADMQGRYLLSDSRAHEQLDLKITVLTDNGFRLVRMSQFNERGELIADGFNLVSLNQRMLRLRLSPRTPDGTPFFALIKFHYPDMNLGCAADRLVPILTLEPVNPVTRSQSQYRLVKVSTYN